MTSPWRSRSAPVMALAGLLFLLPVSAFPSPGLDQQLLSRLHQSNQDEISAAKLAQDRAQSPEVKAFGKSLERERSVADGKLREVAKSSGIELKEGMLPIDKGELTTGPSETRAMNRLRALQGIEFDREFQRAVIEAHRSDLSRLRAALPRVSDPGVRRYARNLEPSLKRELARAESLDIH